MATDYLRSLDYQDLLDAYNDANDTAASHSLAFTLDGDAAAGRYALEMWGRRNTLAEVLYLVDPVQYAADFPQNMATAVDAAPGGDATVVATAPPPGEPTAAPPPGEPAEAPQAPRSGPGGVVPEGERQKLWKRAERKGWTVEQYGRLIRDTFNVPPKEMPAGSEERVRALMDDAANIEGYGVVVPGTA